MYRPFHKTQLPDGTLEYLSTVSRVSVPMLQSYFGITYTQAVSLMETLTDICAVAKTYNGLYREVNAGFVSPRELSERETEHITRNRILLGAFAETVRDISAGNNDIGSERPYKRLLSYGYLGEFDGRIYCGICPEQTKMLVSLYELSRFFPYNDSPYDFLAGLLPIARSEGYESGGLFESDIFDDDLLLAVRLSRAVFNSTAPKPEKPETLSVLMSETLDTYYRSGVMKLLCLNDYKTKKSYISRFNRSLKYLKEKCDIPEYMYSSFDLMRSELDELTLTNIKLIKYDIG